MADLSVEQSGGGGGRLGNWWRGTRAELRRVVWPGREEVVKLTSAVLFVTVLMTLVLGGADWVFTKVMNLFQSIFSTGL